MRKKHFTRILAVLLMLALAFSITACAKQPEVPVKPDKPLRRAWVGGFTTIDPHYVAADTDFALSAMLYESFYEIDTGQEDPRLAESFEVSPDGLTYTYHLKKGVKFQTGEDFTSADVLYSIGRAQESPYMMGYLASVADVQAPDDYTVVFTLHGLSPSFHIEVNRVRFLSEAAIKDLDTGFSSGIPGGTGPYSLESIIMDQKVVLKRSETYHGSPAPIGTIEINVLSDTNAAIRAFEAGESDFLIADGDNWERLKATGNYKTYIEDTISVRFFALNNEKPPLDNPLVRQAINYAVDKDDMIIGSAGGYGVPAGYIANPNMNVAAPRYEEIFTYSYDPQKARDLLAEAGYANGLTITDPIITGATDEFAIPAQILKEQLAAVGIQIEISVVEMTTLVMDMILGNYAIGMMGIGLEPDASLLAPAYITDGIEYLNLSRYSNARVDELFALGGSTLDLEARKGYYKEAFDIASREAAYLPLYVLQATVISTPGLQSTSYRSMYYWYWED